MSASSSRFRFYRLEFGVRLGYTPPLARGLDASFWRPTAAELAPPGVEGSAFAAWWAMHHLHLFANGDYGQFLIRTDGRVIHRSGVYPRYVRFPFMGTDDLQIGDTWTHPDRRGEKLASIAMARIVAMLGRPGRRFWYITAEDNSASLRAVERVGFSLVGTGERRARFGIGALGAYVMTHSGAPAISFEH